MFNEWPRRESRARRMKVQKESPLCSHRQSTRLKHDKTERWPETREAADLQPIRETRGLIPSDCCDEERSRSRDSNSVLHYEWAAEPLLVILFLRLLDVFVSYCALWPTATTLLTTNTRTAHIRARHTNSTQWACGSFSLFYFHFHPVGLF